MSTGGPCQNSNEDDLDLSLQKPMSLESVGAFKYTLKKKKKASKWTPFDLGAPDSTSEGGSLSDLEQLSRLPSPTPVTSTLTSTTTIQRASAFTSNQTQAGASTFPTLQEGDPVASTSGHHLTCDQLARTGTDLTYVVAHMPRTQEEKSTAQFQGYFGPTALDLPKIGSRLLGKSLGTDQLCYRASNSPSIEAQADNAMASLKISGNLGKEKESSGNSNNNSVEWDPDLPRASTQCQFLDTAAAPNPPVTYTTVGSIVNPKAAPQFTAPNRIQREGSARRSLLPLIQSRQHDSFLPHRVHSPLNMPNGLHHAHQLVQPPNHFNLSYTPPPNTLRPIQPTRPPQQIGPSKEQGKIILAELHDSTAPNMFSGNRHGSAGTAPRPNKASMVLPYTIQPSVCAKDAETEAALGPATNTPGPGQGPVQGLEKMQTLQRLAKFENPMRSLALSRLSEFSVSKSQAATTVLDNPGRAVEELLRQKNQSSAVTCSKAETGTHKDGELDRAYQFPLPNTVDPSKPQANPLFGAFSPSTMRPFGDPALPQIGYLAALTAGPPGQRQYQVTGRKAQAGYADNSWAPDLRSSAFNIYHWPNHQPQSLWSDTYNIEPIQQVIPMPLVPSSPVGRCNSVIQDTAPVRVVSKYYPHGLPGDMTGHVFPISYDTQEQMDQIPIDPEPQTEVGVAAKKAKELDDWFYSGQRRFATMSADDLIREYEDRQLETFNPFRPIAPGSRKPLPHTQREPTTAEDSKEMSVADATAPLLDAAFGSLLTYATSTTAPDSERVLSKFENSPAWLLDTSETGKKSFYGEDWGPAPKRFGRDPRRL